MRGPRGLAAVVVEGTVAQMGATRLFMCDILNLAKIIHVRQDQFSNFLVQIFLCEVAKSGQLLSFSKALIMIVPYLF